MPRPPAENRVKLYGLYKQATEGNVQGIMPRPEGYTIEDEGAKKKWDAWKKEEGLSRTQAKRRYILYLIETMRVYASGTQEARELLSELEFLWDQIKDVESAVEDLPISSKRLPYPYNVARLVISNIDQSDRFSSGTPWPLQSNYTALILAQQHKNNFEQIYLHSRKFAQPNSGETSNLRRLSAPLSNVAGSKFEGLSSVHTNAEMYFPPPTSDDLRAWQSQVNLIVNKLSKEFALRKSLEKNWNKPVEDTEEDQDPNKKIKKKLWFLVKRVGFGALEVMKNLAISLFAIFFVVWCVNKSVIVQRTIVKKQLRGKSQKELIINMVMNTDENKWFIRLLALVNKFVGFV